MNEDNPDSPTRPRGALTGVRLFFKLLPVVGILFFLAYYMTERTRLFPDNRVLSDPPRAEYLVFPPEHPAEPEPPVKPVKEETTLKPDAPRGDSVKESAKKDVPKKEDAKKEDAGKEDVKKEAQELAKKAVQPEEPEITGSVEGGYVVIFLSRKLVALVKDQKYLRAYQNAIVPGGPKGGKADRSDMRSPVGTYYIVDHEPQGSVMTLVLSYPNSHDAAEALKARKITQPEYQAIVRADKQRATPPFNTRLGGPVRIRGDGGAGKKPGDICITPEQMEVLWMATRRGTPVMIVE